MRLKGFFKAKYENYGALSTYATDSKFKYFSIDNFFGIIHSEKI